MLSSDEIEALGQDADAVGAIVRNAARVALAIIGLRGDPAWQAELALARQGVKLAFDVASTADEELRMRVPDGRPPADDAGCEALDAFLNQQSALCDAYLRLGVHELLSGLLRLLRAREPEIDDKMARAMLLVSWLRPVASSDDMWQTYGRFVGMYLETAPHAGRPRKIPEISDTPSPQRSWPCLNPALAQQAYEMDRDGAHWTDIARALWPNLRLTDAKARNRIRSRVNRLIQRGRISD